MTLALAKPPRPRGVSASVAAAATQFETKIGGRDHLIDALCYAPKSKDIDYFLGIVGNPAHTAKSLADLCVLGGITVGELVGAYRAGELARAQAFATARISTKLADVAGDTMERALRDGGLDEQRLALEHKKLALDMGRLLTKAGGLSIAMNQQVGVAVGTAGGALERMQAATDVLLYGEGADLPPAPVVEAEVVEGDGERAPEAFVEGDWREDLG